MNKAGKILDRVVENHPLGKLKVLGQLRSAWANLVGETVAEHATPIDIREGTLIVEVDAPVWAQELSLLKTQMLGRLRTHPVSDLRFVLRRAAKGSSRGHQGFKSPEWIRLNPEDQEWIDECGSSVHDPDLRGHVTRLLEVALSRQRGKRQ